jgi:hypothetical protein
MATHSSKEYKRKYYQEHREKVLTQCSVWREKNKSAVNKRKRLSYHRNKELTAASEKERLKAWKLNNLEHVRAWRKQWYLEHRKNPMVKLNNSISCNMRMNLKRGSKKGRKWEELVSFTVDQLKKHLERQFTKEMSWDNYGSYWWIDHIIPIKAFNFETPDDYDFKRCWALKNLRPLEKIANIKKKDKVDKPFQPSLRI